MRSNSSDSGLSLEVLDPEEIRSSSGSGSNPLASPPLAARAGSDLSSTGSISSVDLDDFALDTAAGSSLVPGIDKDKGDIKVVVNQDAVAVAQLNSNGATALHMLISFVGAGVLGLPFAFSVFGLGGALIVMPIIGAVSTYAMVIIVSCKIALEKQGKLVRGYGDIGFGVSGRPGAIAVDSMIVLTQVAFCCAYLIFIGENANSVIPTVSSNVWIAACIPGLALLVLYRHIKSLSPFALMADIANLCGILVVISYDLKQFNIHETVESDHTLDALRLSLVSSKLPYFVGVALYCYEGMGVILHIHESMEHKESFNKVLVGTMFVVTSVYLIFGTLGYLAYGQETREIITLNLGGGLATDIVKMSLSLALYLTYPLMMFPVFSIVETTSRVIPRSTLFKSFLRILMVIASVIIAIAIPNFGDFISLVGAGACAALALVLPAYFHNRLLQGSLSTPQLTLNYMLIVGGTIFGFLGTWDAGSQLWHKFSMPSDTITSTLAQGLSSAAATVAPTSSYVANPPSATYPPSTASLPPSPSPLS